MDELTAWIEELRRRVDRGELDGRTPIDVGRGCVLPSAELAAKIMLADLDHYDDLTLETRQDPLVVARWRLLLEELRRLREQIG